MSRFPGNRVLAVACFLGAGLLINVLVAWACDFRGNLSMPESPSTAWEQQYGAPFAWPMAAPAGFGAEATSNTVFRGLGFEQATFDDGPRSDPSKPTPFWLSKRCPILFRSMSVLRSGWPLRSLERSDTFISDEEVQDAHGDFKFDGRSERRHALPLPRISKFLVLPLMPVWPGMLINTLLYALVVWGTWRGGLGLARQYARRRTVAMAASDSSRGPNRSNAIISG
jgi:hypothetical protein